MSSEEELVEEKLTELKAPEGKVLVVKYDEKGNVVSLSLEAAKEEA